MLALSWCIAIVVVAKVLRKVISLSLLSPLSSLLSPLSFPCPFLHKCNGGVMSTRMCVLNERGELYLVSPVNIEGGE